MTEYTTNSTWAAVQPFNRLLPSLQKRSLLSDIVLVLSAVVLLAVTARVEIPGLPRSAPTTLLIAVVPLIGVLLGSRLSCIAVASHLFLGLCGLPVMPDSSPYWFLPPILFWYPGLYFGALLSVYVCGFYAERGWSNSLRRTLLLLLVGDFIVLFFYLVWMHFRVTVPLIYAFLPLQSLAAFMIQVAIVFAMSVITRKFSYGKRNQLATPVH